MALPLFLPESFRDNRSTRLAVMSAGRCFAVSDREPDRSLGDETNHFALAFTAEGEALYNSPVRPPTGPRMLQEPYLVRLTNRLADGLARLPEGQRDRHASWLASRQNPDGGF